MAAALSPWQKLESLLFPVPFRNGLGADNRLLQLYYFRGRYMLATCDAVYSDGAKYRPLREAFAFPALKEALPLMKHVLVLGTGLASAVHIFHEKGWKPHCTLVDTDPLVLEWAIEFLPPPLAQSVRSVHADACWFVASDSEHYDLIIVDIFFGREVPAAVTQQAFLLCCKARLKPGGFLVLNFMPRKDEHPGIARDALAASFSSVAEICSGLNRIYIVR